MDTRTFTHCQTSEVQRIRAAANTVGARVRVSQLRATPELSTVRVTFQGRSDADLIAARRSFQAVYAALSENRNL